MKSGHYDHFSVFIYTMATKLELLEEYAHIIKDTPYALKTYLQTYDNTQSRYVPLDCVLS